MHKSIKLFKTLNNTFRVIAESLFKTKILQVMF